MKDSPASKEREIQARLRELADEVRELRRTLSRQAAPRGLAHANDARLPPRKNEPARNEPARTNGRSAGKRPGRAKG